MDHLSDTILYAGGESPTTYTQKKLYGNAVIAPEFMEVKLGLYDYRYLKTEEKKMGLTLTERIAAVRDNKLVMKESTGWANACYYRRIGDVIKFSDTPHVSPASPIVDLNCSFFNPRSGETFVFFQEKSRLDIAIEAFGCQAENVKKLLEVLDTKYEAKK